VTPELTEVPERIDGQRVFLRAYTADDALAQWAAIEESRAHLQPWLTHVPGLESLDAVRIANARDRAAWVTRERLIFGLFELRDGRYLGEVALHHLDWKVPLFELGYWIRRSAEGRGLMREGLELVCRLALEQLGGQRIEARVDVRNVRSRRVLEAVGFEREGTLRRCGRDGRGELIDVDVFALLARGRADA
jgi:RimJ/RimL family protein N-acetyltransferase